MADKLRLRCSALPLAFRCPGSVRRGDMSINETNDAADMGTAAHAGLATLVETGRVDWDSVPDLAKRHNVDADELRVLLAQGAKLWAQVSISFPEPMTELELGVDADGFVLSGHADILGRSANVAHVGDWKTGRLDSDYREQLLGYAALALLEDSTLTAATAGVLWVRDGEYEHHTLAREGLQAWEQRVKAEIVEWDGTYRPGSHCTHCPRAHECAAAKALARRDVAVLLATDEPERAIEEMTPEQVISIVEKARTVSALAERVVKAAKARVANDGDLVGAGKRLTLQHEERRRLLVMPAFEVLQQQGFDDAEMAEVMDLSLRKAEQVAAKKAGKGKGAAATRALDAALEQAGAVQVDVVTKLVTRRA